MSVSPLYKPAVNDVCEWGWMGWAGWWVEGEVRNGGMRGEGEEGKREQEWMKRDERGEGKMDR